MISPAIPVSVFPSEPKMENTNPLLSPTPQRCTIVLGQVVFCKIGRFLFFLCCIPEDDKLAWKIDPRAKSGPLPVFVNKVSSQHSHVYLSV